MAKTKKSKLQSVTRWLFVTTQLAALGWVTLSYLIALYATVKLSQPFPVEELSRQDRDDSGRDRAEGRKQHFRA